MEPAQNTLKSRLVHIRGDQVGERPVTCLGLPGTSDRLQERILDATSLVLHTMGYHLLTLDVVAGQASVTVETIHRWWTAKSELVIDAISRQLKQPPPLTGDPETDVRRLVRTLAEAIDGDLAQVLPALALDVADDPRGIARLAAIMGPFRASASTALDSAGRRGTAPHDIDADLVVDMVAGSVLYRRLTHKAMTSTAQEQLVKSVLTGQLPKLSPKGN